jgi:WD40 repeat protein
MTASTGNTPGRIFISYRREETAYPAGWLFDRLASHFGRDQVFKDVDSIEPGDDFVERITSAVESCDVLLALIGDRWLAITNPDGQRRLDDPDDFVRLEIEAALARNVRVIPILVDGAHMPPANELPASLAKLERRQALELSPSRFGSDTQRLLSVLDRTIAEAREQTRREAVKATARPARRPKLSRVTPSRIRMGRLLAAAAIVVASGTVVAISLSGSPSRQPSDSSGKHPSGSSGRQPILPIATLQNPANSHGTSNAPQAVAFGQGGNTLAEGTVNTQSPSGSGPTYLWDVATKHITATLTDPKSRGVYSVAFCGRTLAVDDRNGNVYLWDPATKSITATLTDPASKGEHPVAFGRACTTLAVGDRNGKVYLWDVATQSITATFIDPAPKRVSSVAYARDGATLAVGDGNGKVYLWDVATQSITATATFTIPHSGGILSLATAPAATALAAAGDTNGNSKVYLWDAATKNITTLANPAGQGISSLRFGPDGTTLAVGGSYGKVYLWDAATKRIISTLASHPAGQRMNSEAFGTGGTTLAAACGNGKVYLWNIASHASG